MTPKLAASSKKGGTAFGFPDVCKTPSPGGPIPIPYPNTGQLSSCDKVSSKVFIEKKETVVENSRIPRSQGDEPGTLKGVVSNTNMDCIAFKKYSPTVYAEGKKVVHHTAMTAHNGSNANFPAGCHVSPSQTKVWVAI